MSASINVCPFQNQIIPAAPASAAPNSGTPVKNPTTAPLAPPPVAAPVQAQVASPTARPTETVSPKPSPVPTGIVELEGESCEEAFVYCPGRSISLADTEFNEGVTVESNNGQSCGWSIEYSSTDGVVDDCVILTGLDDTCNPDSGVVVGRFFIGRSFLHYCLPNTVYVSNSFHAYVGSCEGNDNGEQLNDKGECNPASCDPTAIAKYATSYSTYPLISEGGPYTRSFTFNTTFGQQDDSPWGEYEIFPMSEGKKYISGHACLTRSDSINY